jgi:short-subunit dehydrogenase
MLPRTENNKFTFITGATSEMGYSIACKLKNNHNLVLSGRDFIKLQKMVERLDSPNKVKIWTFDLIDINGIQDSLKLFFNENPILIDNFIHVAGITRVLPLRMFEIKKYHSIFNVNFFSAVEIIKLLLAKNNRTFLNNIVLISALFSKYGDKGNSMYAASKGAMDSFVKSLAVEASPTKVNSILPGAIHTEMTRDLFGSDEYRKYFHSKYLLGMGSVMNISNYVNYLIQEDTWITGQNIVIDGGASCH